MNALSQNVNALIFMAGFVSLVAGLSSYSWALAAVVAGGLLMLVGAAPYVRPRKG